MLKKFCVLHNYVQLIFYYINFKNNIYYLPSVIFHINIKKTFHFIKIKTNSIKTK